ncbi:MULTISPECIES: hypothetical protein [Inquilinus]
MSQNAKAQVFADDPQLISDLNDIARIAEGMRQVGRTSNYSNTARIGMTGGGAVGLTQIGLFGPRPSCNRAGRRLRWPAGARLQSLGVMGGGGPSTSARIAARLPGVLNTASPYADPIAAVIMWQDYAARGARASAASTGDPILDAVVR